MFCCTLAPAQLVRDFDQNDLRPTVNMQSGLLSVIQQSGVTLADSNNAQTIKHAAMVDRSETCLDSSQTQALSCTAKSIQLMHAVDDSLLALFADLIDKLR